MKKLLLAFCVFFSVLGNAQTWTNYTKTNTSTQLVNDYVNAIVEDKEGSIWFATNDGLSKYDGVKWTNYHSYVLPDWYLSTVFSIAIDSAGNKWISNSSGIMKFDGENWTNYNKLWNGNSFGTIYSIAVEKDQRVWVGGSPDILTYIPINSAWGTQNLYEDVLFPAKCIAIDSNGTKWVGNEKGIAFLKERTDNYYKGELKYVSNGNTNAISIENNGLMWFGTNKGVSKYDGTNWTYYSVENGLASDTVYSIAIDIQGVKWFGTAKGVSKFDGTNWKNYSTSDGLVSSIVNAICIDSKGNKWFGTTEGVSKFDNLAWTTFKNNGIASNIILSSAIDKQGNKWFGTDKGVSKYDGINWTSYRISDGLSSNKVKAIGFDAKGNNWFGTDNGISKYDGKNWTSYLKSKTNRNYEITAIAVDLNDHIWITTNGYDASKFDGSNWINYDVYNGGYGGFVFSIAIDSEGNKWFGTGGLGVSKFDGTKWNYFQQTPILSVNAISIDKLGTKWFSTDGYGVSKLENQKLTTYISGKSGLLENENLSMAIDADGVKWFGSHAGVSKLEDSIWTTYSYNYVSGVNSISIDYSGDKWFGTYNGIKKLTDGGAGHLDILNKIQRGTIFHDLNTNGKKDPNETTISGQIVKVNSNYTTTQNNGLFYTSLTNGNHTFTYRPQANWQLTTDSSITVSVTDAPIKDTLYFGVQAIANRHEVETKLTGTATRPRFQSNSWINYANLGTLVENGTVSYTLADNVSLVQSIPVADSTIGKRLVWKYSNLIPNEQRQISITTQMPGVNFLGDTLVSIVKIKSGFSAFSDTLKQVLTGAFDPNDKLVAQGIGSKGYVLFGKELEYTIRFQNTGTDTAFNVNIRDTLDVDLDVASLQIVASSHPVKLDLRGQNEATFRFENILLPDSNVNQLGSNGFVKYTIRPKKNLAENTSVKNKAYIYFDFNPAIITNETENTYVSKLPSVVAGIQGFQSNKSASIFPNPAKEEFTIVFPQSGTYEISLANIQGKSIRTWNEIVGQETTLSLEGLEPGMYLYTAQGRNGQKYMGKIVVGK